MFHCAEPVSPAAASSEATRDLALARCASQSLKELSRRVHPAWVEPLVEQIGVDAAMRPGMLDELVLSRFDLRWPDLSMAETPLELLWLLPPPMAFHLCGLRALYAWRHTVYRSVDAAVRRAARALAGDTAFGVLMANAGTGARALHLPPSLDAQHICALGWAQIKAGSAWRDVRGRRLVDLMLPPSSMASKPVTASFDDTLFLADLPALLPEYSWLFGSNPAKTS